MILSIKEHLSHNVNDIEKILKYFNYNEIEIHKSEVRAAKPGGNNATTCRIKLNEYLTSNDFSLGYKGDLFGLIQIHTKIEFHDVVNTIKLIIDQELQRVETNETSIFEGFFDDIYIEYETQVIKYDNEYLNKYKFQWNMRFLEDNISLKTQKHFHIGYDYETNRITIPWRTIDGELLGIMGRSNYDDYGKYKYLPILPFPKQCSLYGIYENQEYIRNNKVYIFESEKSVMQLHTYGYHNAAALGGNSIHSYQIEELLKLNVTEFILCFDEGLEIEVIKAAIESIRENLFMRDDVRIGVLLDKDNLIMKKGSKCSPSDNGKLAWEELINKHIKYMKG